MQKLICTRKRLKILEKSWKNICRDSPTWFSLKLTDWHLPTGNIEKTKDCFCDEREECKWGENKQFFLHYWHNLFKHEMMRKSQNICLNKRWCSCWQRNIKKFQWVERNAVAKVQISSENWKIFWNWILSLYRNQYQSHEMMMLCSHPSVAIIIIIIDKVWQLTL